MEKLLTISVGEVGVSFLSILKKLSPNLLWVYSTIFFVVPLYAQQIPRLSFQEISFPPGASEGFTSAAQDSMGFIWFGSFNALWKYNGRDFEKITPIVGDTNSLTRSRPEMVLTGNRNDLWIGTTRGGISRLQHRTGNFTSWRHDPEDDQTIGGNEIGGMAVDIDGQLWVGSNPYCLNHIDPATKIVKRYYPDLPEVPPNNYSPYLGSIAVDPTDNNLLWIGSPFGIFEFDIKKEHFTFHPFPKPISYIFKPIPTHIFIDPRGDVWTTSGFGPLKWLRSEQQWKTDIFPPKKRDDLLELWGNPSYLHYSNEEILILPRLEGLYIHNVFTGETQHFDETNGYANLIGNYGFRFCLKDQQGVLWFSARDKLFRAATPGWQWKYLEFPNRELRNWTAALLPIPGKNAIFIGTRTGEGLIRYDLNNNKVITYRYSTRGYKGSDVTVHDLCFDQQKNTWIASSEGLLRLDTLAGKMELTAKWNDEAGHPVAVKSVFFKQGVLWVGTVKHGLYALSLPENQETDWSSQFGGLLRGLEINSILGLGDGRLLLGTNHGLSLYDFTKNTFYQGNRFLIPEVEVTHLEISQDGSIWVSTYGHGLYRFDRSTPTEIENFTTNIISNGNDIYYFCFSENGDIWMHTDGGMLSFNQTLGRYLHYPEFGVGLRGPLTCLPDGNLVTGSAKGVRFFHPKELEDKSMPPIPYVSSINIGNRTEDFPSAPDYVTKVKLKPSERELSLGFAALNLNRRTGTEFSYRLLGLQEIWQQVKGQRLLTFNNLEPGNYLLEMKAVNEYGKWSEQAKQLAIIVLPPFYETLWFRLSMLALFGILTFLFYKYLRFRQMKRLQAIQQERERLSIQKEIAESKLTALQAQMNPHFIFNSLNSINWYILKNRSKEASQYLTKFSRLVRLILDNSKNLTIPLDKELDSLKLYLDLEAMRFEGKFEYTIRIDASIEPEEVLIPPLILQPFVENAIWHGLMHKKDKGKLLVQIYPENGQLKCIVEDNGIGRKASQQLSRYDKSGEGNPSHLVSVQHQPKGMKLTNDRLQLLHRDFLKDGMIRVIDLEDENGVAVGTRVEVILPWS